MEGVPEILYETCYHATGICADSSPGTSEGGGWGISSFLSSQGLKKLQEKWGNHAFPKSLKEMSLFISPKSEYVAVAARHQIRLFHKDDKYMEPCGFYSGFDKLSIFSHGAWSDSCALLGLVDDKNTIYIVKPSGMEITKIQTKKSASVVGIFMFDNGDVKNSYKCALNILTSDGLIYRVEINQELLETVPCSSISKNEVILKKQYPRGASCLDFHQNLSFLILVGPTGITGFRRGNAECSLSLWHVSKDSELQLLFSIQCEVVLQIMGNHEGPLTTPKVVISPEGTYVAVLDLIGNLETFSLDSQKHSLSAAEFSEELYQEMGFSTSPGGKKRISDIADIAWWSDSALVIANRNSGVTMVDVSHGVRLLKTDLAFSSPVLGRPTCYNGLVFLLECDLDMKDFAQMTYDLHNKQETHGMMWKLLSFSERSVLEMYKILINGQQYGAAFQFAERHAMDKDEIFKSQWLRSNRGMDEINSYLYNVKDANFVLSECLTASAPTEEATRALISYGLHMTDKYRFVETENSKDSETWNYRMMRLQLLQSRDRLDTFLGINMGRFSMHDYGMFRVLSLNRVAVGLAEHGKIGALNLLFKRHLYSMSPFVLEILAAIPETIPVQTYSQLLPDRSPPSNIALRDKDWVEVDQMVCFIQNKSDLQSHGSGMHVKTEYILKQLTGIIWPSVSEISRWYMERAMEMDSLSGQLENCLSLVDTGRRKGLVELQQFYEDALCFYDFVYSGGHSYEENTSMSLVSWKQLSDYEKFKMMMKGAKEDTVMETLRTKSIPFMQRQSHIKKNASSNQADASQTSVDTKQESLLVTWLKEIALKNNLEIFLVVIDEACKDFQSNDFFKDETEATEVILECLYLCTLTDRWNVMASILSKVPLMSLRYKTFPVDRDFGLGQGVQGFGSPRKNDKPLDMRSIPIHLKEGIASASIGNLEERVKQTEGHIESGRLLAYYQVPKPLCFFHGAHSDEKGVKQLLRLILSKFGRRQPMRSDNEWANMWRDMLCLQEKAFPFLESEYMLLEFCRGLLKAGKFSLARNYLKGIGTVSLAYEKAEYLVIQAAREYFFSASTLDCSEIWKAKECLNLFPNSKTVRAEIDLIDALTVKLPNLGVTVLPVQYRQIRSPMEIINMVLRSQSAAYLNVDEILEVAKLLGLNSADDIATVEESVAREAAVTGDLELAFDLCLVLARKGHGSIWDLCAAIGRGPTLDKMDVSSRKELISFALSHCDEESVLELLQAWKDLNLQSQCENLVQQTGTRPPNASISGSSQVSLSIYSMQDIMDAKGYSINMAVNSSLSEKECLEQLHGDLKRLLSNVGKEVHENGNTSWDNLLKENGNFFSFAALQLPWLFDFISSSTTYAKKEHPLPNSSAEPYKSVSFEAAKVIISWLVNNNIAPRDDLVASLAKSVIKASSDEEKDRNGCLYLLNLGDAFQGVEVIEEQMRDRKEYKEISGITDLGMLYGLLHNSQCRSPSERRNLLLQTFQGERASTSSGVVEEADSVQSAFWREWKSKLEEQKNLADQARALEEIIPGIETARFLSGDKSYVRDTVFAFIDSVRHEKRHILQNALKLADAYGISQVEVLLHYLGSSLVSEIWTEDDIEAEISPYKKDLLAYPSKVVHMISSNVYSEIDGHKKQRLSYLYGILSDCYSQLGEVDSPSLGLHGGNLHVSNFCEFYNALKEQCKRVSFINGLNFKNIAGLDGLNVGQLHNEVCSHIDESTVEALAQMVDVLVCNFDEAGFLSRQDVYKHLILCLLNDLENGMEVKDGVSSDDFRVLIFELEKNYERCSRYFEDILEKDALDMFRRYYTLSLPCSRPPISTDDSSWQECLVLLLNLWIKLANDIHKIVFHEKTEKGSVLSKWDCLSRYLTFLLAMVIENKISTKEGWETIFLYVEDGLLDAYETHVLDFCKTMVFAGCGFGAVADLYIEVTPESQMTTNIGGNANDADSELCCFYVNLTESLLSNMGGSPDVSQKLQVLMSSLSKQVDCSGNIKKVRYAVREVLYAFSENVQVSNMYRVYALELLQSITGKKEGSHNAEISTVLPWEGWAESLSPVISESVEHDGQDKHGMGRKFTNTLVALKSNEMVSAAWPGIEITPNDLNSIQSAVSCFSYLATSAVSGTHMHTLQCLLKEWEGLFSFDGQFRTEEQDGKDDDVHGTGHNWNNDEWDDGWETFQDDLVVQEEKCDHAFSVHPLHACWRILLLKLVGLSQFSEMVKCMDQSLVNPKVTLLDEDEARSLSLLLISIDCFVALKFVLLLPYQTLWFECLAIVDAKLKEGGSREASSEDSELLALILSAGIMSAVVSDAQYRNVTSYLCYLAGYFLRGYREDQLNILKHAGGNGEIKERCYIFGRIIFPHFIAELVKANQYILAGVLVTKFMLSHSSLSLINVAEASLRKFLVGQLQSNQEEVLRFEENKPSVVNSYTKLRDKLSNSLESALLALSTDMK
ncbi:MAG2-interacting protein 2 [Nymphaea thermarum]|nr:MAG2-interacting protein 2 [Nymphaea thermarum]